MEKMKHSEANILARNDNPDVRNPQLGEAPHQVHTE